MNEGWVALPQSRASELIAVIVLHEFEIPGFEHDNPFRPLVPAVVVSTRL